MKPKVGVVQFRAICPEGNEHPLSCGITYEIARRLTTIGGVEANAILLGQESGSGTALAESSGDSFRSADAGHDLNVPTLGAQYESDFILVGEAKIADGLLFYYRVYQVETNRLLHSGCVSGLRTSVFELLDGVAQEVRQSIGLFSDEEEEPDLNPVFDHVEFEAFVEYCLGREESLPRNAMDHFERGLELEPGFRMALVEYLSHCYQIDDLARSLKRLDAYLKQQPEDQEILIAAANLCLAFNRVDEGLGYASRAFVQRPGDVEPRVIMARFLFAKELPEDARVHLEAALGSPDRSPEGLYCLGRYYLDLGDFYRSRDYFEECLEVDPGFYVALRDLQCCYYELGDYPEGIDACEKLLEADPTDAGSYYNLGLIYQRLGRSHLALKFFQEAVRQEESFYKGLYMIAEYYFAQGDFEEALKSYEESQRVMPDSSETLGRIGDCHYQLGRSQEAFRHYARARRADPLFESARLHLLEGTTLAEDGDLESARGLLLQATELDDELVEAWNQLAGVLLHLGKTEEALNVVRRASELEPDSPEVLANLLTCCRCLPLGVRFSGWARKLARETRERLRYLRTRGAAPSPSSRRRFRRRLRSLTWYGLQG